MSLPPPRPEREILAAIRQAANLYPELILWRLSQGGLVRRGEHTYRAGLSVNGAPDLMGIFTVHGLGVLLAIEVKTKRGALSEEQRLFLELISARGGIAAVVRSVEEFHRLVSACRENIASARRVARMGFARGGATTQSVNPDSR